MKSKEYRIYLDGELINFCCSQTALMGNVISLHKQYGKDRVNVKECNGDMDEEKRNFLNNFNKK